MKWAPNHLADRAEILRSFWGTVDHGWRFSRRVSGAKYHCDRQPLERRWLNERRGVLVLLSFTLIARKIANWRPTGLEIIKVVGARQNFDGAKLMAGGQLPRQLYGKLHSYPWHNILQKNVLGMWAHGLRYDVIMGMTTDRFFQLIRLFSNLMWCYWVELEYFV